MRLKGGDPFVFGRGGEEMLACAGAGVRFEVVPGITSAIAAPALAGIPVTHRGLAQSFAVVTGSTAHGDEVDLARVATSTDTLVVLMSAGKLAETCAELIAAGRAATEPAAIVQWAGTPEQRTVVGTLEESAGRGSRGADRTSRHPGRRSGRRARRGDDAAACTDGRRRSCVGFVPAGYALRMEPTAPPSSPTSGPARAAEKSFRRRVIVRAIFLILTLFSLYVLWPSLLKVFSAWPDLLTIQPGWFVVMFVAEIASFACAWALQRLALRTAKWFAIATAQISGNAFSRIVPGGAAAGAAIQFRLLVTSGLDPTTIGTGLTATTFISSATLFALPVLALPAIIFGAPAPKGLVQSAWLGAALFVLAVAVGAVLLSADRPLMWVGRMIERVQNRMHKDHPPKTGVPETLVRERNAVRATLGDRWWLALLTAWGNWLLDYLALLAAVAAVGARPRPALVLLAYVAAAVLGMIPITPGGLGFVEAGLSATLVLAGVSPPDAVLATLAYRLVSYWLPLVAGPFAYLAHRHRYVGRTEEPAASDA